MHGVPFILDVAKIESKTWLYKLFVNPEWLDDTHIFVGMHYLNVKQVQYKVNYPYSTSGPFFMQMLKRLNDKIEKGQATIQDATNIAVIEDDIMGSASPFSRGWADCDFVYLPLNNNNHWVLLVLDVKKKKIRVYNSKSRRADSV
ncbi:unnamed protein product, partial [Cuscuta europaea]